VIIANKKEFMAGD